MSIPGGPLPRFDGYVFDLDGTIYLDEKALPGAVEATGMTGAFALTGATTLADVDASDIRPDYLLNSLYDLLTEPVDEGSVP